MRGGYQGETTNLALDRELTVLAIALGTQKAGDTQF